MLPSDTARIRRDLPELVVGLVGRIGIEMPQIGTLLEAHLTQFGYTCHQIRVTDTLKEYEVALKDSPLEERYVSYIETCNKLRRDTRRQDVMAYLAMLKIAKIRSTLEQSHGPVGQIYIINQLKRREEVDTFRSVYGNAFFLISCHGRRDYRSGRLAKKISSDHPSISRADKWIPAALELIQRDDNEINDPYGQRVQEAFPLADVIIDGEDMDGAKRTIERFFDALFGSPRSSPTADEHCNAIAFTAATRSADLSRQVGAAIFSNRGEIIAIGCNEAPKAGGGYYWQDDHGDARDVTMEEDINAIEKKGLVIELLEVLDANNMLLKNGQSFKEVSNELLNVRRIFDNTAIMGTLEYGRAVHAEMAAITDAARRGHSLQDCTLYVTTFPCHNCAKHIVAAGIERVVYLEPYAKSHTSELYPDSIAVDDEEKAGRVVFKQFIGITHRSFARVFSRSRRKGSDGKLLSCVQRG